MDYGQTELPAREGVYARATCKLEMDKNHDEANLIQTSFFISNK
jgi:hypothetical protein